MEPSNSSLPSDQHDDAALDADPAEEGKLRVLDVFPQGYAKSFTLVGVTFNQPMTDLLPYDRADRSLMTLDPPIPGEVVWLDRSTLGFIPETPVAGSLSVTVRVSPEIRSLSGAGLEGQPPVFTFTLPQWEIQEASDVAEIAPETDLRPVVNVTFNQPVELASLDGNGFFIGGDPDAPFRIPAVWSENLMQLVKFAPLGYRGGSFRAAAKSEIPRGQRWTLVIGKGVSPGEGLLPLEQDLEVESGTAHGDLVVIPPRNGTPVGDGGGEAGTLTLQGDGGRGYYAIFSFSNPVRMSDAAPFVDIARPAMESFWVSRNRNGNSLPNSTSIQAAHGCLSGGSGGNGKAEMMAGPTGTVAEMSSKACGSDLRRTPTTS
ncbi:MAG: hypothetical protein LBR80_10485 [Deltaproteobacteria bacterium]|nr:hypothetical protein [Deltaproteobacteria bacterium]